MNIVGVPRSIGLEDTGGILNLGVVRWDVVYKIVGIQASDESSKSSSPSFLPIFHLLLSFSPTSKSAMNKGRRGQGDKLTFYSTKSTSKRSCTQTTTSTKPATTKPPPNTPDQPHQHCKHWCTHEICKWGQGCHYRHLMPMTLMGLYEVGLRDWPGWYRRMDPGVFVGEGLGGSGVGRRRRGAVVVDQEEGLELGEQILEGLRRLGVCERELEK